MNNDLTITSAAFNRIEDIRNAKSDAYLNLRITVSGGGCSGFKYEMTFDSQINDDDLVFEHCVVIDRTSFLLLSGATIDYVTTLMGENFKISNPNASSGCGCGESFSL
jgi:iron-sulfur cluster insertion protein